MLRWVSALAALSLCSCSSDHGAIGREGQAIINGVQTGGAPVVPLSASPNTVFCSGVFISPSVVLTAAHCIEDRSLEEVRLYTRVGDEGVFDREVDSLEFVVHPLYDGGREHDLALVLFDIEVERWTPLPHRPFEGFSGEGLVAGYGVSDEDGGGGGFQRAGLAQVKDYDEWTIELSGEPAVTCNGDSGGPFITFQDGVEVLAGIHSTSTCERRMFETRVDAHFQDFIVPQLASWEGSVCVADGVCAAPWFCEPGVRDTDCSEGQCESDGVCDERCLSDTDCICPGGDCLGSPASSGGCSAVQRSGPWWVCLGVLAVFRRRRRRRATISRVVATGPR